MPLSLLAENDRKEQLSQAYIAALAAGCGFTISVPNLDRDSIDIQVSSGSSRRASVAFQLKATSNPTWADSHLKFPLKAKNYNDLVLVRQVPLLLAVMVLPKDETEWIFIDAEQLVLRECMWWFSLIGEPRTDQRSKQAEVPKANVLTMDVLEGLIKRSEDNTL